MNQKWNFTWIGIGDVEGCVIGDLGSMIGPEVLSLMRDVISGVAVR